MYVYVEERKRETKNLWKNVYKILRVDFYVA